jgi:hypothetical protein
MIFLNPAVLFGLLAASIPVLIHLLNLRKLKKIEFSTLSFLKELRKNKIRKIKLKQWLLLALRVAVILFLVFAFARPALEGLAIGGTTSAAKTSAVFVVDDTFSMSVVDGRGSYINQAKETINDLMNQLQEGDDAAIVLVSGSGEDVKLSNNLQALRKEADNLKAAYTSGNIHSALIKAGNLLAESNNFNKEIYVLSDFQKGSIADEKNVSDLGELLNDKIKLYAFNYSGKEVFNVGISELKLNTQIFEKNKPVSFRVTVKNYSKNSAWNNGVVSLFINGERSAQQSVTLPAGESASLDLEAVIKKAGPADIFAEIEDDDILQDNRRYISLDIPEEIPVIIFFDDPAAAKFVEIALTAVNTESSLKITGKNLNQIPSVNFSQYAVIIIAGTGKNAADSRLRSFVENGGGLFLMPGSNASLGDFNQAMTALGLPPAAGAVNKTENAAAFLESELNHPVFGNIFSTNEKKKLESPDIYRHFKVNTGSSGVSIIKLIDNSSFLSEFKPGKGKIFVLSTAPVLSWSNFPLKSLFAPLINKSVYYLASKDTPEEEYKAGADVSINLSGLSLPQVKIVRPDKTEDFINAENEQGSYLPYKKTDLPGNYLIFSGEKIIDNFSVNADSAESAAEYLGTDDFKKYLKKVNFKGRFLAVDKNDDPAEIIMQARFGSELWRVFLVIALLLAIAEMTLARNVKKETAGLEQP